MVEPIDRNTLAGFSQRTLKNLAFMRHAREKGADVHIVTHLVVSMLGLIVFPFEHIRRDRPELLQIPLSDLAADGWPGFNITLGNSDTLDDLIFHIRNALSHRRISFSSDSRKLDEVEILFVDKLRPHMPDYWRAEINGAAFASFVARFSQFLGA
jgi:hypothetical protein